MFIKMLLLFVAGIAAHTYFRATDWKKKDPTRKLRHYFRDTDRLLTKALIWQGVFFFLWYSDTSMGGFSIRSLIGFSPTEAFLFGYLGDSLTKHLVTKLPIPIIAGEGRKA